MSAKQYVDLPGITVYDEEIKDYIEERHIDLTQAEYDALPSSKNSDNINYHITDVTSINVDIDDSTTGLDKVWSSSKVNSELSDKVSDDPTFSEASTRENIASGESFSTILGKIKKFFSDLKTVAFTGNYSDLVDKGTVAIANGGTGATTKQNAAQNIFGTSLAAADVVGVPALTSSWASVGYMTKANTKSWLGLKNGAYVDWQFVSTAVTMASGATSATISNSTITTSSVVIPLCNRLDVALTGVTVSAGSAVITTTPVPGTTYIKALIIP